MKYEYVVERARDEKQMLENSCLGETDEDTAANCVAIFKQGNK